MSVRAVDVPVAPLWARLYGRYEDDVPNHPGKRALLRVLLRARRAPRPFAWRVRNGSLLAISPLEGLADHWTVGWTCFRTGTWEPHVERCLRQLLGPGDSAIDVGANLGYFSAVMAQCVGPSGRVIAFEPTPPAFARLSLCRALNGFTQLETRSHALGSGEGRVEIRYDPRLTGEASLHRAATAKDEAVTVRVCPLDLLVSSGEVPLPDLVKIDVEGHELEVLRGAHETIARARPAIVFELNEPMSKRAGWGLPDVSRLLADAGGDYRLLLIDDDGVREIGPDFELGEGSYVDVLALPANRAYASSR